MGQLDFERKDNTRHNDINMAQDLYMVWSLLKELERLISHANKWQGVLDISAELECIPEMIVQFNQNEISDQMEHIEFWHDAYKYILQKKKAHRKWKQAQRLKNRFRRQRVFRKMWNKIKERIRQQTEESYEDMKRKEKVDYNQIQSAKQQTDKNLEKIHAILFLMSIKDPNKAEMLRDKFLHRLNEIQTIENPIEIEENKERADQDDIQLYDDYTKLLCDDSFKHKRRKMWKDIIKWTSVPDKT